MCISYISYNGWGGVARATEARSAIDTMRKNTARAGSEHLRSRTDSQIHPSTATRRVTQLVLYDRHANRTRREQALLTAASGGHISAEGNVQLKAHVSIAAGIMARAAGQRDRGPAHAHTRAFSRCTLGTS